MCWPGSRCVRAHLIRSWMEAGDLQRNPYVPLRQTSPVEHWGPSAQPSPPPGLPRPPRPPPPSALFEFLQATWRRRRLWPPRSHWLCSLLEVWPKCKQKEVSVLAAGCEKVPECSRGTLFIIFPAPVSPSINLLKYLICGRLFLCMLGFGFFFLFLLQLVLVTWHARWNEVPQICRIYYRHLPGKRQRSRLLLACEEPKMKCSTAVWWTKVFRAELLPKPVRTREKPSALFSFTRQQQLPVPVTAKTPSVASPLPRWLVRPHAHQLKALQTGSSKDGSAGVWVICPGHLR